MDISGPPSPSERRNCENCWIRRPRSKARLIRYVEAFENGGEAAEGGLQAVEGKAIVSKKAQRPIRSGRSRTGPSNCRCDMSVLGGGKTTNGKLGSCWRASIAAITCLCRDGRCTGIGNQDKVKRIMRREAAAPTRARSAARMPPRKDQELHWLKPENCSLKSIEGFTDAETSGRWSKGLRQDKRRGGGGARSR